MTSSLHRPVAVGVLLALALAACGGGDGGGANATTTDAAVTTTTDAAGEAGDDPGSGGDGGDGVDPAALTQARDAALTLGDMPDGWTMIGEQEDSDDLGGGNDAEEAAALGGTCPDVQREMEAIKEQDDPADVTRSFAAGSRTPTLESDAAVFADEPIATRAFELLAGDDLAECMGRVLASSFGGAEGGEPEVSRLEIDAGGAEQAGWHRVRLPATVEGRDLVVQVDVVALRVGTVVHSLLGSSIDELAPFPELVDVVDAAIRRTAVAASA